MSLFRPLARPPVAGSRSSARGPVAAPDPVGPRPDRAPWRVFGPDDMVEVRRLRTAGLRALPSGTVVCLVLDAPGSRGILRAFARRSGLTIERELIVVPSTRSPLVVLDDAAEPVGQLWRGIATVPPGIARGWCVATLALSAARRAPWQWSGAVLPGRVVLGRTP